MDVFHAMPWRWPCPRVSTNMYYHGPSMSPIPMMIISSSRLPLGKSLTKGRGNMSKSPLTIVLLGDAFAKENTLALNPMWVCVFCVHYIPMYEFTSPILNFLLHQCTIQHIPFYFRVYFPLWVWRWMSYMTLIWSSKSSLVMIIWIYSCTSLTLSRNWRDHPHVNAYSR